MRLIDADALIDDIRNHLWDWTSVDGIMASTVLRQTISDVENQPTIVPQIVMQGAQHSRNPRYDPGYWNGFNGGTHYGQYFDMEDVNRVREMTEVVSVLREYGIEYILTKFRRRYRIAIAENDYHKMPKEAKQRILNINIHHDTRTDGEVNDRNG